MVNLVMSDSPFSLMQRAIDIIADSPHPTSKVAATLAVGNFVVSKTNHWPAAIEKAFGRDVKIGNSSGTIHAETACILAAPKAGYAVQGAALYLSDPPCPNCAKNMAEAGITALYIDHKGFDKDFARRRGDHFEHMSMRVFEKAGVSIFRIFRKEERLEPILKVSDAFTPDLEKPIRMRVLDAPISAAAFIQAAQEKDKIYNHAPYVVALCKDTDGGDILLSAEAHPVIGYTEHTIEPTNNKYSFTQRPLNRVLMSAAKEGLEIQEGFVFSSICPTARELVNFVGAGFTQLHIHEPARARDEWGPKALKQLTTQKIIHIN